MTRTRTKNRIHDVDDAGFALLAFAGLGEIAAAELGLCPRDRIGIEKLPNYDLIRCRVKPHDVPRLAKLRTVEDVFRLLGGPQPAPRAQDLTRLDPLITAPAILEGLALRNALFRPKKPKWPTFNCFVKQDRDRQVRRKNIANHLNRLIAKAFPRWRNADPADVEIWAFYVHEVVHVGFRLSDGTMRYRGRDPVLRKGTLRPTVAAAMVSVAAPRKGETIVDPMCGSGTILDEGLAREADAAFSGGDIDRKAVYLAGRMLAGTRAAVRQWDARDLPLAPGTVDCIVCNLPFGKQYSSTAENPRLYASLLANWVEKLKPQGRMVLLTADCADLETSLDRMKLPWRQAAEVKVLGLWSKIYRVGPA